MYGRQVTQRLGLTIKRRPHLFNVYASSCSRCGRPFTSKKAWDVHMAMAHRQRLVYYKQRRTVKPLENVTRGINPIEGLRPASAKMLTPDMKRVWRLSGQEHADLVLVESVLRKAPSWRVLYALCLRLVRMGPTEVALPEIPKRLRHAGGYVSSHLDLVQRIQKQRRYTRLKSEESRARLLALGLAEPQVSLTYAERAASQPRKFRKEMGRATHYQR